MTHLITGGAGCIGSELAAALLARGESVKILDNLSSGHQKHVPPGAKLLVGDVGNPKDIFDSTLGGVQMVWHLAAKTDIKFLGQYDFEADYRENLQSTWTLLKAVRQYGIQRFAFASSAAVYGDQAFHDHRPNSAFMSGKSICEWCGKDSNKWAKGDCPRAPIPSLTENMPLAPVSMYGATKLACEAIIRAMASRCGIQCWIFRYCSIVSGKARTNGNMVIPDFIHKLRHDPSRLEILGDGQQTKPSLHVSECVEAMQFVVDKCKDQVSVYNIGAPDAISVSKQAHLVCDAMGHITPKFEYTGGVGGWPGDVPSFRMDVNKLARLGWRASMASEQACERAIKELLESGE